MRETPLINYWAVGALSPDGFVREIPLEIYEAVSPDGLLVRETPLIIYLNL